MESDKLVQMASANRTQMYNNYNTRSVTNPQHLIGYVTFTSAEERIAGRCNVVIPSMYNSHIKSVPLVQETAPNLCGTYTAPLPGTTVTLQTCGSGGLIATVGGVPLIGNLDLYKDPEELPTVDDVDEDTGNAINPPARNELVVRAGGFARGSVTPYVCFRSESPVHDKGDIKTAAGWAVPGVAEFTDYFGGKTYECMTFTVVSSNGIEEEIYGRNLETPEQIAAKKQELINALNTAYRAAGAKLVNSVKGFLEAVTEEQKPKSEEEYNQAIQEELANLEKMEENLMELDEAEEEARDYQDLLDSHVEVIRNTWSQTAGGGGVAGLGSFMGGLGADQLTSAGAAMGEKFGNMAAGIVKASNEQSLITTQTIRSAGGGFGGLFGGIELPPGVERALQVIEKIGDIAGKLGAEDVQSITKQLGSGFSSITGMSGVRQVQNANPQAASGAPVPVALIPSKTESGNPLQVIGGLPGSGQQDPFSFNMSGITSFLGGGDPLQGLTQMLGGLGLGDTGEMLTKVMGLLQDPSPDNLMNLAMELAPAQFKGPLGVVMQAIEMFSQAISGGGTVNSFFAGQGTSPSALPPKESVAAAAERTRNKLAATACPPSSQEFRKQLLEIQRATSAEQAISLANSYLTEYYFYDPVDFTEWVIDPSSLVAWLRSMDASTGEAINYLMAGNIAAFFVQVIQAKTGINVQQYPTAYNRLRFLSRRCFEQGVQYSDMRLL